MSVPRLAQLRQMQALNRRKQLDENASRASAEERNSMFSKHHQIQRHGGPGMPMPRFAMTNRPLRDRDAGVITAKEWEESVAKYEDSGKNFRRGFYALVIVILLLLGFAKYDVEANLEVPQIESGSGFGEVRSTDSSDFSESGSVEDAATSGATRVNDQELEALYQVLGVKGRLQKSSSPSKATRESDDAAAAVPQEDPDKSRRRENYRVRQELKDAYEKHRDGLGQLVHCGRGCEAKNQQVELAYTALASQVDRELYGVLLNAKGTKEKRSATGPELKKAFEDKKAEILANEDNDEDKQMALEEIKDAFEILSNHESRAYYHLYGQKPPAKMKHMSARHGGWGQEIQLGTFKYRLIFAWLDYFGSSYGELVILGCIVIFVLMRLPQALQQTQRLVEEMEWEERINNPDAPGAGEGSEGDAPES